MNEEDLTERVQDKEIRNRILDFTTEYNSARAKEQERVTERAIDFLSCCGLPKLKRIEYENLYFKILMEEE